MSKRRYTRIKEYESVIVAMREAGKTNREIADELGVELRQIKWWVSRYNKRQSLVMDGKTPKAKGRPRKDGQPPRQDVQKELERLRMENKLCNTFCAWTQIEAENLEYRCVTKALEEGSFYISTGPAIHSLCIEDDRILIECDPATRIVVNHDTERLQRKDADQEGITTASFKLRPESGWFRVTIYDENGNFAMTRPYYPEEYSNL